MLRSVNLDFLCIFSVTLWSKGIYVSSSWGKNDNYWKRKWCCKSFLIKNIYLQNPLKRKINWRDESSHLTPEWYARSPSWGRALCAWVMDGRGDCDFDGEDICSRQEAAVWLRVDTWEKLELSVTSGHGTRHSEHGGSREGFSGSPPHVPWRSQGWNMALTKVHASHGDGLGAGALRDPSSQWAWSRPGRGLKPSHQLQRSL